MFPVARSFRFHPAHPAHPANPASPLHHRGSSHRSVGASSGEPTDIATVGTAAAIIFAGSLLVVGILYAALRLLED